MPRNQPTSNNKQQHNKVRCCDCSRCTRDTSGRSFSIITGEFFMGTCPLGHGDGLPGRVFMDKARICTDHQ